MSDNTLAEEFLDVGDEEEEEFFDAIDDPALIEQLMIAAK